MTVRLPQKYHNVVRALIPYRPKDSSSEAISMISLEPALPCFICQEPANRGLLISAQEHLPKAQGAWLTFPICPICEERQVKSQEGE